MSPDLRAVVMLLHLVATLLMAAPFYMLIVVNERARFAVPAGYNTDRYMENVIKNTPQRCYFYLATVFVTGLILTWGTGAGWGLLVVNWALAWKVVALFVLAGTLSYVHLGIQPRIEALVDQAQPGQPLPEALRPQLAALRIRRKRLSAVCLFLVLSAVIMGVRVFAQQSPWLTLLFLVLAAAFAWRCFRTPVRYGWI